MSFTQQVKNQICDTLPQKACCQQAFILSVLLCSRGYAKTSIGFHTENKEAADGFAQTVIDLFGVVVTITSPPPGKGRRRMYYVSIDDSDDQELLKDYIEEQRQELFARVKDSRCCAQTFVKGAFLMAGSMIEPDKRYHLEFAFTDAQICELVKELLSAHGFEGLKITTRGEDHILYCKDSETMIEILTYIGATESTFELMNLKIEKELRNQINRQNNCEFANMDKTIASATEQINAIKKLQQAGKWDYLSSELQFAANLRLENPESSLADLCALFPNPINRSTLSRRFAKICKIAKEEI